ncbi:ABC transporter ATP-binding protein, partial [Kocuria oceani]
PLEWAGPDLVARVGTVFQEPEHQFLRATVRAELELGPRLAGTPAADRDRRTGELLDRLRLTHLADANPFTLSGGEKRRLSVATVLATDPDVLVLDEPTFGQDALTWAELVDLLLEVVDAGTAVLAVTHDEDFVRALGAEVLELGTSAPGIVPEPVAPARGAVVESGAPGRGVVLKPGAPRRGAVVESGAPAQGVVVEPGTPVPGLRPATEQV